MADIGEERDALACFSFYLLQDGYFVRCDVLDKDQSEQVGEALPRLQEHPPGSGDVCRHRIVQSLVEHDGREVEGQRPFLHDQTLEERLQRQQLHLLPGLESLVQLGGELFSRFLGNFEDLEEGVVAEVYRGAPVHGQVLDLGDV